MAIDPISIHAGMQVLGIDGEPLGRVVRFDPDASPRSGSAQAAPPTTSGAPAPMPDSPAPVSPDVGSAPGTPGQAGRDAVRGYGPEGDLEGRPQTTGRTPEVLENERGGGYREPVVPPPAGSATGVLFVEDQGFLGVGAGGLEVPLGDVLEVTPGDRVIIDCTRDQAIDRFGSGRSLDLDDGVSA